MGLIACLLTCFCSWLPPAAAAYQQHQVYFQNTDYELHIYRIYGEEPGKTLLIIGGIQGNEPGGYLAADLYVETSLKKGNLIVVPRANFSSILMNVRGVNGDMNRKFDKISSEDRDGQIIEKLKALIEQSDYLLNLHDGSGFYSDTWVSDLRNPALYGQSIIADCDTFYSKKYDRQFNLERIANRVCDIVNDKIKEKEHHFSFNNHRTSAKDSIHSEQRKSATYFALMQYEIPAFGIETSKNIPEPSRRVRYQSMVINAFMEEFGIVPDHPRIALPEPRIKYIVASVNDSLPVAVYDGESLYAERGDSVSIIHVEANYERGLTANILGVGSLNDLRKKLVVNENTDIVIKKDNLNCGRVHVRLKEAIRREEIRKSDIRYLILRVDRQKMALKPGEHQSVQRGHVVVLEDLIAGDAVNPQVKVNFKGFVGNKVRNDGEDRGYQIDTSRDLLVRYSLKGKGRTYPIMVTRGENTLAKFYVDIED